MQWNWAGSGSSSRGNPEENKIDLLTGQTSSNFSAIRGSNEKWDQLEINFNNKLTLLENFSLEDILRLSFFLAGRLEKEVPVDRV